MPYKDHLKKLACQKRYRDSHKEELREKDRIYSKKHPEKSLARQKAYVLRHPERAKAKDAKWYAKNKLAKCAKARKWYADNIIKRQEYDYRWYRNNCERKKAYSRLLHAKHPERGTMYQRNRRALKMAAGGKWTHDDITEQYFIQNGRCFYCCKSVDKGKFEADHVVPLSKGGTNFRHNLALACKPCNSGKRAKSATDFAIRLLR